MLEQNKKLPQKRPFPFFTVLLCVFLVVLIVLSFVSSNNSKKIASSEFVKYMNSDQIAGVYFYGATAYGVFIEGNEENKVSLEDFKEDWNRNHDFYFSVATSGQISELIIKIDEYNGTTGKADIFYDTQMQGESWITKLWPFIYIALIIALAVIVFRAFSKMSGKNMDFGKNKARVEYNLKVRFSDVAGCEEEKRELAEIVEFLKNPKKFTDLGARIPKGVLMVGPPGTGKTLLGKAIAGEAEVPFFSITGSDFVEMFVGVGAARVRDLFQTAKKSSPCLIFIDEIDAVGRQRGTGLGNTNDEREQTLNQLLVQMDGFESSEGIIVIAATNRPDVLDPALLRAGRFDRRITVGYPDVRAREKIMKLYTKDKPMAKDINYTSIARSLGPGTTGADIENIINEAAILAARDERSVVTQKDIMEGIRKVAMGPQRKSAVIAEEDRENTAYHEAGHAILSRTSKHLKQEVQEVSIIPRGIAAGYTAPSAEKDLQQYTEEQILDQIRVAMGGRAAELIVYNRYATGAVNDIKHATQMARSMVTEFGMSEKLGSVRYSGDGELFLGRDFQAHNNISEKTAELIDSEIKTIIGKALTEAVEIIKKHRKQLDVMVKVLLEKETIYSAEVDMVLAGKSAESIIKAINKREEEQTKEDEEARQKKIKQDEERKKAEEERIKVLREKALIAFSGQTEQAKTDKTSIKNAKGKEQVSGSDKAKKSATQTQTSKKKEQGTQKVSEKTASKKAIENKAENKVKGTQKKTDNKVKSAEKKADNKVKAEKKADSKVKSAEKKVGKEVADKDDK